MIIFIVLCDSVGMPEVNITEGYFPFLYLSCLGRKGDRLCPEVSFTLFREDSLSVPLIPAPPSYIADLPPHGAQGEGVGQGYNKLVCAGVSDSSQKVTNVSKSSTIPQFPVKYKSAGVSKEQRNKNRNLMWRLGREEILQNHKYKS